MTATADASPYRHILVAVDGSETAAAGLDEAIRFARLTQASLHVVHMVDALERASGFETCDTYANEVVPHMRAAGQAVLKAAEERAAAHGITANARLIEASASNTAESILQAAQTVQADLIVLGTHGRRGLDRAFAGSDAEQVVRRAQVPVLLVRLPAGLATAGQVEAGTHAQSPQRVAQGSRSAPPMPA
jgi:nucleotide-binding universal stress UspA family protein